MLSLEVKSELIIECGMAKDQTWHFYPVGMGAQLVWSVLISFDLPSTYFITDAVFSYMSFY